MLLCGAVIPGAAMAGAPASPQSCSEPASAEHAQAQVGAAAQLERSNRLAERGKYAEAVTGYAESRRLALQEGDQPLAALAAANGARASIESGALAGVESALERAGAATQSFADPRARAQLLIHVGRSWALLAARSESSRRAATRRAADSFLAARGAAEAAADERLRSYAIGYLGDLYGDQGLDAEALSLTRQALYAAERADAPDARYRWQWQLGRLEVASGNAEAGLESYRSSVATLRDIRAQTALAADAAGSFRRRAEPIYMEFVDLLLTRAAGRKDNQALLVEARDALEDLKVAELRDYFSDSCLDSQRHTAPDAIPDTVVVYPVLLPDRVELITSRDGRLASHRVAVDRDTLTEEVRSFREALERRTSRRYLSHAQILYDWLIRPIESSLEAGESSTPPTLVFVPDGALRTIPFAALWDRERKQFLIERHPIAVTPSLSLTDPRPIESGQVRVLAAGISEAVGGFSALPSVTTEIEAVRGLFPGKTLLDSSFVVENLESELTNVPFGIVHIASHGEFGGEPSENFLLAYDGRVYMEKLSEFVGATRFRADHPLELLTLSACESAAGDDRAALGLAGVALRAGARSALATLWSVNDQATADFAVEFYRQLADPENSRAEALQHAQLKLLNTRHYRHPSYWAPFLLISSWL